MPWIGFIFEAIGFAAGTAATISTFVLSTLASVAIGQVAKLFRPKASPTDASSLTRQQSGQSITSRQAAAPRRVLFGTNGNFAGIITFMCVDGNWLHLVITLTGHQVSAIRKMFFDGVEVPLSGADGDLSRTGASNYAGYVNFEAGLGTRNQAAFASLIGIGGWTSAHRQRGCAAVHVSLCWNQSLFPNGLPNITFAVDGALVYDPRNGTRAFSKNAALCTAEYLTNATWGLGAQTKAALTGAQVSNSGMGSFSAGNCVNGDLTATAWSTDAATSGAYVLVDLGSAPAAFQRCRLYLDAANYAGTYQIEWADGGGYTAVAPVFAPDVIGWNEIDLAPAGAHRYWRIRLTNTPGGGAEIREIEYYTSDVDTTALVAAANTSDEDVNLLAGGSEKRYTCNGSFDTSELPRDVIPRLNSALGGGTLYQSGRWGIYPGVWPGASLALGDGDLRAPISVQTRVPHAELFNGVKGLFLSPTNNWQLSDFPPYAEAGYLAEDANEAIWTDVEFPFTTSGATVQRLSKMMLHRRRQQISFTGQFKLQAWQVQPYDVVTFTHARFGWVNKTFEVQTCDLVYGDDPENPVVGVNLKLVELDSTVFDWSTADEDALNTPPVPALPAPGTVAAPTGLAANTFQTTRVADGVSVSGVRLTWTSPADINVTTGGTIIVQYKKHADANWIDWGPCDGASVQSDVVPLVDGTQYDFQIWAENIYGAKSAIVSTTKIPTATQVTVDTIGDGVGFYRSPKGILYSSDLPYNAGFDLFADTATLAEGWDNFAGNAASYTRNGAPYSGLYAQNLSNVGGISGYTASKPFGVKPGLTYVLGARVKASSPTSAISELWRCFSRMMLTKATPGGWHKGPCTARSLSDIQRIRIIGPFGRVRLKCRRRRSSAVSVFPIATTQGTAGPEPPGF